MAEREIRRLKRLEKRIRWQSRWRHLGFVLVGLLVKLRIIREED